MKLSVYIPTLACDGLFDRCVASIRESAGASWREGVDYEIVVVENVKPLSEARNVGMRRARGDWIATVDADDVVAEDWFPEIWKAIGKAEARGDVDDILFDSVVMGVRRSYEDRYGAKEILESETVVRDMLHDTRLGNHVWRHVTSRRIAEGFTFARVPVLEDYVSMPKLVARARKVLYIPKPLYHYIARKGSLCSSTDLRDILAIAIGRAREVGGAAVIGASKCAYERLYDHTDAHGIARRWIRRHIVRELTEPGLGWKWRLKFLTAFFGIVIRRPKEADVPAGGAM